MIVCLFMFIGLIPPVDIQRTQCPCGFIVLERGMLWSQTARQRCASQNAARIYDHAMPNVLKRKNRNMYKPAHSVTAQPKGVARCLSGCLRYDSLSCSWDVVILDLQNDCFARLGLMLIELQFHFPQKRFCGWGNRALQGRCITGGQLCAIL